eukprot:6211970-Pleurochrysis_carterae.AAC.5
MKGKNGESVSRCANGPSMSLRAFQMPSDKLRSFAPKLMHAYTCKRVHERVRPAVSAHALVCRRMNARAFVQVRMHLDMFALPRRPVH